MRKTVLLVIALFALVFVVKYLDQEAALKKTSLIIDSKNLLRSLYLMDPIDIL